MIKKSKKFVILLFLFWCQNSFADGFVKGKPEYVRTHNGTAIPAWAPPTFWFTLKGVASAGNCAKIGGTGKVLFAAKTAQELTLLMAAIQENKEIAAHFNDTDETQFVDGFCNTDYITIENPRVTGSIPV